MNQPTAAELQTLFRRAKTIAVVGLSNDRTRPSNGIARYLQRSGFRVIPVNPALTEVLGEKSYPSLLDIPESVDIVDVFRRPEAVPEIARQAGQIGAQCLWMQLGVANAEAAGIASTAGLIVVEDRCIMIEHMRLSQAGPTV